MKINSKESISVAAKALQKYGDWTTARQHAKMRADGVLVIPRNGGPSSPKKRSASRKNSGPK